MDMGLFIVVLFIVAALMRVDFFFYVLYVFFGVYLLSRLWVRRGLAQVRVERSMEGRCFWGERHRVEIEVVNDGWLPLPWLHLQERLPQPLGFPPVRNRALSLMPREKAGFSYELDCRRRGYYEVGPLVLSSGDLLAADGELSAEAGISSLVVYPRLVALEDLGLPSRSPFGTIRRPDAIHRDPTRVGGVRDYRPGDSLRHIHWRASAAQAKLQTKVFDPVISLDTAILLDLERAHYQAGYVAITAELAVTTAASIASRLHTQRQPFSLASNGCDPLAEDGGPGPTLGMRTGQAHLMAALEVLGRVETQEWEPFDSFFQRQVLGLPWGCTVLIISGTGESLPAKVLQLRRSGFRVVTALVDYHVDLERHGQVLEQAGATVWKVRQSQELARMAL
ncbi:MAG: DUF58 domain-containing protein [Anaerolineae bacterium]|nr:DUF58 domain-containing protein [Anaerolineae bacterium]